MESIKPKVTVIIPVHNAERYVRECINSVLSQTYENIELILVENASTDKSRDIIQEYCGNNVRMLISDKANAAAARNLGIQHANGEYIQFLDADDYISQDKIERQIDCLSKYDFNQTIVSFGYWECVNGEGKGKIKKQICHDYEKPIDVLIDFQLIPAYLIVNCFLVPLALAKQVGPWDESLSSGDDGEWFARIYSKASKLVYCETGTAYYRDTKGSLSNRISETALTSRVRAAIMIGEIIREYSNSLSTEKAIFDLVSRELYVGYPYYSSPRTIGEAYLKIVCPHFKPSYPIVPLKSWIYYYLAKVGVVENKLPI